MSDDGHQQPGSTQDETKVEDINAPINIKVRITFFLVRSVRFLNIVLFFFLVVSYLLGREFYWRRSFLQNQTEHQTYKAPRRIC